MRICLFTATALPKLGGQEAVVDALARHFTRLGHRAVVLVQYPRPPLRTNDSKLSYPVVRHPRFISTRRFVGLYKRCLLKLHARERFDVIHCHDVYPTGYLAALCKRELGVPVVITSHGGDVKEGNVRIVKPGMRPRFIRAVESADALISIGNFTEEGYRKLSDRLPPIVSIPNGIDLSPYQAPAVRPDRFAHIHPGSYILFLGRLAKRKGVDVLIDAMAKVPGARCIIAGAGDEQAALEAQINRLGLNDRVQLVGRVDGADKIWLLQNARCVAMPSRVWEAFPLVLIEAFAAGKPVIGSAVPGIADLIEDGKTGRLVPQESPANLAAALLSFVNNGALAEQMGDQARLFAQRYAWGNIAQQHLSLYQILAKATPV
jgi:glycosyltransferase involved in cell wall biosynthesis